MPGLIRTAAVAFVLGLMPAGQAAASAICDELGFALANLSEREDVSVEVQKYGRAIAQQQQSLDQLAVTTRQAGCSIGSVVAVGGTNLEECRRLEAKSTRMQRNLEILETKKQSLQSTNESGDTRQQLVSELDRNRCNEDPVLIHAPADDGSLPLVSNGTDGLETIRVPATEPNYNGSQFVDLGGVARNGSFQTMCVRACDGAYFPVSSHASPLDFRRDAQVCSMMCPGTATELYYHPLLSESADMLSAETGHPYEDLDNAYRFRTTKPGSKPECGCNFALYYKEMLRRQSYIDDPSSVPEQQSALVWVKPELRPSIKADDRVASNLSTGAERDYLPSANVRVVGPKFLPDKRIDFTKPISRSMN